MKKLLLILFVIGLGMGVQAQKEGRAPKTPTLSEAEAMRHWVDSVQNRLSLRDQAAQLMVLRVPIKMDDKRQRQFEKLMTSERVGGVCFFAGTASKQVAQTKRFQSLAKVPLMVCLDGEWGLGMRLTDSYSFPQMMMMGALDSVYDDLIRQMGSEIGYQCRKIGVNVNFAPVVDLNSNPKNPVIGGRSFGENKREVARKGRMYILGQQSQRVTSTPKHFPGHGDTDVDSHRDLPVIDHTRGYIDTVDTYPFRSVFQDGARGVMVAHLQVNALDNRPNRPSSLSSVIVNDYLRKDCGFGGLVFTDGIDMEGVAKHFGNGQECLEALLAGCDVVILPKDVKKALDVIVDYAKKHPEFEKEIEDKCRRVLEEKYWCGLNSFNPKDLQLPTTADNDRCHAITKEIVANAVTLVNDEEGLLPLSKGDDVLWLSVGLGDTALTSVSDELRDRIRLANKVVINLYGYATVATKQYGASPEALDVISQVAQNNPSTVLVIYGSPYILNIMDEAKITKPTSIVMAYQSNDDIRSVVPDLLYGLKPFKGHLPVAVSSYPAGFKYVPGSRRSKYRDYYSGLREAGIDSSYYVRIDSLCNDGVRKQIYPGCEILVAKDGKVLYQRGYGRQTYSEFSPAVDTNTIYDLASLTKVCATTFAVMKLVDAKKIKLDDQLSTYLPYLKKTNKSKVTVRQALSHFARLKAFEQYYKQMGPECTDYVIGEGSEFEDCRQKVLQGIAKSDLIKDHKYLYSDLGFILLGDLVEKVSGQSLDIFMEQQFYAPLGMSHTCFNPILHDVDSTLIAPTEIDTYFRNRTLRGEVHDQNASVMGGVSGHAGLFSTASDLAILYQMLLDGGVYHGQRFLSKEVIDEFNTQYYLKKGNRRALGFDKPLEHPRRGGNTSPEVSQKSMGHTGFTGTMVWVDPEYNLVYIFLSNRTFPDSHAANTLASSGLRTEIQSLIYQSILKSNCK